MPKYFAASPVEVNEGHTVFGGASFEARFDDGNLFKVIQACQSPPGFDKYAFFQWRLDGDYEFVFKRSHMALLSATGKNKLLAKEPMVFGHSCKFYGSFILGLGDGKSRNIWPFPSTKVMKRGIELFGEKQETWYDFQELLERQVKSEIQQIDDIPDTDFKTFGSMQELIDRFKK